MATASDRRRSSAPLVDAAAGSAICTEVVPLVPADRVLKFEKVVVIAPCSAAATALPMLTTPAASASPLSADEGVTVLIRSALTCSGVQVGCTDHTRAAAADTTGAAIDVPDTYAAIWS